MIELLFQDLMFGIAWESVEIVAVLVFFANIITVCMPNKSKYKPIQYVLDLLNVFAMNILQNANRLYPQRVPSPRKRKAKRDKKPERVAGGTP